MLVSEADHPFWEHWWPQGHIIGWEHTFVHEIHHLLTAIRDDTDVAPARRDLRGRLPRRRGLRRDAALRRVGPARGGRVPRLRNGTYVDLQDLMTLTAQGQVMLHTSTYPLDAINDAMADLDQGRLQGRGILIPAGA